MPLMKIHLIQHLSRGISCLRRPGIAALGKRIPCSCNIHPKISLASCLCFHLVLQEPGALQSGSELLLNLFLVFRSGRAGPILYLESIKDGPADLGDEFTCGGLANQPVIL